MSDRQRVIAAARARGISTNRIALALGISTQAVCQQLARWEVATGTVARKAIKRKGHKTRIAGTCKQCGSVFFMTGQDSKNLRQHCSRSCSLERIRKIQESDMTRIIEMRQIQMTWRGIAKVMGCTPQAVQSRLWLFLAEKDMLTYGVVSKIWTPTTSEHRKNGRWEWLARSKGIWPTRAESERATC